MATTKTRMASDARCRTARTATTSATTFRRSTMGRLESGYTPTTMITGSFRRTQDESFPSMLDIAAASMDGTTTEFESMLRLYRIVSQRIRYNRPAIPDDSSDVIVGGGNGLAPDLAFWYSLNGLELDGQSTGQCFEYGTALAALARSAGILARPVSSANWLGGWGNHVFTEAYVPGLPQHGGKRTSSNTSSEQRHGSLVRVRCDRSQRRRPVSASVHHPLGSGRASGTVRKSRFRVARAALSRDRRSDEPDHVGSAFDCRRSAPAVSPPFLRLTAQVPSSG